MAFNADGLVRSENYAEAMAREALPYIGARRHDRVIEGDGGRPLFTARFDADAPEGTVLIVHGFTENVEKYSEIIHSLLKNHLSVVAWDQRGHGRSWRNPEVEDISLTHVDDFGEYVRDMACVIRSLLCDMPGPHRVFCHSMGGTVTALYLEAHRGEFDRAAMCAPMIAPYLNGLPRPVVKLMCQTEKAMGRLKKRIIGSRPYDGAERFEDAAANGRERFDWYESLRAATPAFQNNGPSYGWLRQAVKVTDAILAPGAVEKIDARVRLYSAELDATVLSRPQEAFITRLKAGERVVVKGAKHEIYRSNDAVLFPWWHDVLNFLKS